MPLGIAGGPGTPFGHAARHVAQLFINAVSGSNLRRGRYTNHVNVAANGEHCFRKQVRVGNQDLRAAVVENVRNFVCTEVPIEGDR